MRYKQIIVIDNSNNNSIYQNIFLFLFNMSNLHTLAPKQQFQDTRSKHAQKISSPENQPFIADCLQQNKFKWAAVYIDGKFYLTTQQAFQRLDDLDKQIVLEKNRLQRISQEQNLLPETHLEQSRQINIQQKKVRKNSIESALSRECKTQINELKALKAKFQIQKQLAQEQIRHQNKTMQLKKRRQLKQATTFVIRNQKDKSVQQKDLKHKKTAKNFMIAPHELAGSRASQEKQTSRIQQSRQKPAANLQLRNKLEGAIKYKTIDPRSINKEQVQFQGQSTVKNTRSRYQEHNLNNKNNNASKSKQKSFVITSRKQFSSSSKEKDSFVSGMKNSYEKPNSQFQIQKLNLKLKQMQEKLIKVEKKQKELQQVEKQKQKDKEIRSQAFQEDQQKSRVSSKVNKSLKQNPSSLQKVNNRRSGKKINDSLDGIQKAKEEERQVQKQQKSERQSIFNLIEQKNKNKSKKLGLTSYIVAYNYTEDIKKSKQQVQQASLKQKMAQEISQLKKVIKQLKIQKIKQQAVISSLQGKEKEKQKQRNQIENLISSQVSPVEGNKEYLKNNFMDGDNLDVTFNGLDSNSNKTEEQFKQNTDSKQQNLIEQVKFQSLPFSDSNDRPLAKKQPRRFLKLDMTSKKKFSQQETESPNTSDPRNKIKISLKNSDEVKKVLRKADSNPEDATENQFSVTKSRNNDKLNLGLIRKGKIIKQLINKDKLNNSEFKSLEEQSNGNYLGDNSIIKDLQFGTKNKTVKQFVEEDHQFSKPQLIPPQIEEIQGFPIPQLGPTPTPESQQTDILAMAKKICDLFEIKINGNEQLQFKKYKNCIILKTVENPNNVPSKSSQNKAIVWHYSGKFYIGDWVQKNTGSEDHKNGEGFEYVPDKHYYRGQFADGKRSGYGTMIFANGDIYRGDWLHGQRNGKGVLFDKTNKCYFEGLWKQGKKQGNGAMKVSEKQWFRGCYAKGAKTGHGVEVFSNGDIYQGFYKSGKFNGKGRYFWANGSVYVGEFFQGQRQGFGKWKSSLTNTDIYIGTYKKDKKQGQGKYTWHNGCIFQGGFVCDLKHGQGRVQYPDGRQVIGVWEYGKLKQIIKNQGNNQSRFNESEHSLQIEPRIRPNIPRILQTPSKQMQQSKVVHGV